MARRGVDRELSAWLDGHGYRHSHARVIESPVTGRPVFAAHERDGHITTRGRRALTREQFALPPGPEEKRRGIAGRLPINTLKRARNALTRASMMHNDGSITERELSEARSAVHRAWPSIAVSHARIIHQEPTGRAVYAEHERDGHITTAGRRSLTRSQFALPPGPEEKRRGIKGRLPIDDYERAKSALGRAKQMYKRGHISSRELAQARNAVHKAWPSMDIEST